MARTMTGTVVSNSMDKTVTVAVDRVKMHRIYQKRYTATSTFLAHDGDEACNKGDRVIIEETRPLSKRKRWQVKSIVEKAQLA
ncbi:30S ribosomal protein S17 [Candidatus Saccharibacteria bacterium QS_8_54_8]|nr:MAG: 30S ribosomal protein S17 [Candidatus Saccharibacteria bacterium QS_8_54_8]PSO44947.1 MAG: 30S ribosomal protein S17 [Candidatus Saccharibacteria bacterium SW_7_54_9]